MNNLITDVGGLKVGNAHDSKLASGVTAVIFEAPVIASIAVHGGAPGVRDAALLEPGMTVERVDALAQAVKEAREEANGVNTLTDHPGIGDAVFGYLLKGA